MEIKIRDVCFICLIQTLLCLQPLLKQINIHRNQTKDAPSNNYMSEQNILTSH